MSYEVQGKYSTATFTLRFRRDPLYYIINLIVPCGLLSFITVTTFILQPNCQHRMGLGESLVHYFWTMLVSPVHYQRVCVTKDKSVCESGNLSVKRVSLLYL